MMKCKFCGMMSSAVMYGIRICHEHRDNPVIEGLICDYYKKEHEIMGRNYNIMKRKFTDALTRPWKNLVHYYRNKYDLWDLG